MNCIFCQIIEGTRDAYFIYEDKNQIAILDKYPIDNGHTLVIPREHHETITDMPEDGICHLFSKVPMIARGVLDATNADGFNLGQNNGKAANQIIPHVHVHIIPRYNKSGPRWGKRQIGKPQELDQMANEIRGRIKIDNPPQENQVMD